MSAIVPPQHTQCYYVIARMLHDTIQLNILCIIKEMKTKVKLPIQHNYIAVSVIVGIDGRLLTAPCVVGLDV